MPPSHTANSSAQFVQFGLDKQMAVGGALFELESLRAVSDDASIGWWTMEWWWDQPGVPHVAEFNAAMKKLTGGAATARNWFGDSRLNALDRSACAGPHRIRRAP
jgi:branched-chain amino acid transport system substrate-binding protein